MLSRTVLLCLLTLTSLSEPCSASILGSNVKISVDYSLDVLVLGVKQNAVHDVTVNEDVELAVVFPAIFVDYALLGTIDLPSREYRIDLKGSSILITATNPENFIGSLEVEFDGLTSNNMTLSDVTVVSPAEFSLSDFELVFDDNSVRIAYFYDLFSPTSYGEIKINLVFVPISADSVVLMLCPLLTFAFLSFRAQRMRAIFV